MPELLSCKYIQSETIVVRKDSETAKNFLSLNYEFKELTDNYYQFTKPAVLELVFRDGERDFIVNDALEQLKTITPTCKYKKDEFFNVLVETFIRLIILGKIKVTILPGGSCTFDNV